MTECVIFDIDGTLADLSHRLHYLDTRDYDSFFGTVFEDDPIWPTIMVARAMYNEGHVIVLVSGRSDVCEEDTVAWMMEYSVPFDALYMRKKGDHRADTVVKREILDQLRADGYDPYLAIDDRKRLADMWREEGIMCYLCSDWDDDYKGKRKTEGATLYVMVGPSGAGKTHWVKENLPDVYRVSSDDLRFYATGNFADQSRNEDVFTAAHGMTKSLLDSGIDCVFDATNIKNKDRKSVAQLHNGRVVYVVVNRPKEQKEKDAGWRPGWLLKKHQNTFESNYTAIMNGDNLDNVEVWGE